MYIIGGNINIILEPKILPDIAPTTPISVNCVVSREIAASNTTVILLIPDKGGK